VICIGLRHMDHQQLGLSQCGGARGQGVFPSAADTTQQASVTYPVPLFSLVHHHDVAEGLSCSYKQLVSSTCPSANMTAWVWL